MSFMCKMDFSASAYMRRGLCKFSSTLEILNTSALSTIRSYIEADIVQILGTC